MVIIVCVPRLRVGVSRTETPAGSFDTTRKLTAPRRCRRRMLTFTRVVEPRERLTVLVPTARVKVCRAGGW
jgi:hypothetical protein